ncbi:10488_t:CDS:2 [Cetraspora pellucida]|uniref:10488_t:CDS:1 n=1 Tax=Cetraspora pellucida TaxID=1433469 RepID=A0A9N9DVJ9_9GLOM|nr:10488_t:CDS:2 [Cetraspora pellucida]
MSNKIVKKLDLKITEPFTIMVVTVNEVRVRALEKVVDVQMKYAQLYINENRLYIQYNYKVTKISISCNKENLSIKLKDAENKDIFDEFKFEDELLEEAKGYFIYKTS